MTIEIVLCKRDRNGNKTDSKVRLSTDTRCDSVGFAWIANRCEKIVSTGNRNVNEAIDAFYDE